MFFKISNHEAAIWPKLSDLIDLIHRDIILEDSLSKHEPDFQYN